MRPLFPLLAYTAFMLAGCQTESSPESGAGQNTGSEVVNTPAHAADDSASPVTPSGDRDQAPAPGLVPATQGAGLKAYIDPETGELTTPPEDVRIPPEAQTDTREVREEAPPELIPLEGGGYRTPLGDRFKVYSAGEAPAEETDESEK